MLSESIGGQAVLGLDLLSLGYQEEAPTRYSGHLGKREQVGPVIAGRICAAPINGAMTQVSGCLRLNPTRVASQGGGLGLAFDKCKLHFPHL